MLAVKNQAIKKAYDVLQIISKDEKVRMHYEAKQAELRGSTNKAGDCRE